MDINQELLNELKIEIRKNGKETLPNGTIIYKIKIGNKQELLKLFNLFYKDKILFLKRKKEKFENLLNIPRDSNS